MNEIIQKLMSDTNLKNVAVSTLLLLVMLLLKFILVRKIDRNKKLSNLEKMSLKKSMKSWINFFFVIFLMIMWFSQIQAVFVSLFAVAAAIVLATKEMIMNLTGGILVKMNNHFKIGDRIDVDNVRGFVIEKSLTTTKVLEMGPEKTSQQTTGDIITIPNSIFLSKPAKNESYFKGYSMKSFVFPVPEGNKVDEFESHVLEWSREICDDYLVEAKKIMEQFAKKEGIALPAIEPRSKVILGEKGEITLLLKLPVKNSAIADTEQRLYRKFIALSGR